MSSISLLKQGQDLYNKGKFEEAYKVFTSILATNPYIEEAQFWKGKTEMKLGRLDEAINTFTNLVSNYEKNVFIKGNQNLKHYYYYLALALYYYSYFFDSRTSLLTLARSYINKAISISDNPTNYLPLRIIIISELGYLVEAEALLKKIWKGNMWMLDVYHMNIASAYIHVYRKKGEVASISSDIRSLVSFAVQNVSELSRHPPEEMILGLVECVFALRDLKDYSSALDILDFILSIEQSNALALLIKAEILEELGRVGEAKSIYYRLDKMLNSPLVKSKLSPNIVQTNLTSRTLANVRTISWDPKVWVGRKLSVYEVKEVIGEGGYGYVLRAVTPSGEDVAIKVLKIYSGVPEDYFDTLISEANKLTELSSNQNIVKIFAVNVDKYIISEILKGKVSFYEYDPPRIVMEFMKGGSIADLMKDDSFFFSSQWKKAVYTSVLSIANALKYMHSYGYVHMDVKPQNIFLTVKPKHPFELANVEFKLGDLGGAVRVNRNITQLTVEYAPPEAYLQPAKPYFDTFSLGMTLYVLLTKKLDRPDLQEMEEAFNCYQKGDMGCVRDKVYHAQQKLTQWDPKVPDEVKQLVKSLLSPDPLKRPTASDVVNFMKSLI